MFERYTQSLRRVIFFARYEASVLGSPEIGTEHLLLGYLREKRHFADRLLSHSAIAAIRTEVEPRGASGKPVPASLDLPLSPESRQALLSAKEEAGRASDSVITTGHLLLGLLQDNTCSAAQLLAKHGLHEDAARHKLKIYPFEA